MRTLEFRNDGNKLCRQLMSLIDFSRGHNYQDTHIRVVLDDDEVIVSTFCANGFGREWCNQNHTRVSKSDLPFFSAKKLGIV
jgi:hypothetical protein